MSLKLLLTGTDNPLGRALEHELERESFNLCTPPAELDWTDASAVAGYLDSLAPQLVLNCLGWADAPDAGQQRLIADSARHLADHLPAEAALVQISSYRVFGDNRNTHGEADPPEPLSDIGSAYLQAERALAERERWIALRLSWLIGGDGDNLLTRLLTELAAGHPPRVNRSLRGNPTPLSDAARVLVALIKQIDCGAENWGVMHYATAQPCNQLAFGERVVEVLRQQALLNGEPQWQVLDERPGDEPASAILGVRRIKDWFGVQRRAWSPGLLAMIKQWQHEHPGKLESNDAPGPDVTA